MRTLREILLADINEAFPTWEPDEEELQEWFCERCEAVFWGETDIHRWHTAQECVRLVQDGERVRYFEHRVCIHSGENDPLDAGFYPTPIDELVEVFPKEVTTIVYVSKEERGS